MQIVIWPDPSQIRWSAYAYDTSHVEIKLFMFYSKNYLTRIFAFSKILMNIDVFEVSESE